MTWGEDAEKKIAVYKETRTEVDLNSKASGQPASYFLTILFFFTIVPTVGPLTASQETLICSKVGTQRIR